MDIVVYPLIFGGIAYVMATVLGLPARWTGTILAAIIGFVVALID